MLDGSAPLAHVREVGQRDRKRPAGVAGSLRTSPGQPANRPTGQPDRARDVPPSAVIRPGEPDAPRGIVGPSVARSRSSQAARSPIPTAATGPRPPRPDPRPRGGIDRAGQPVPSPTCRWSERRRDGPRPGRADRCGGGRARGDHGPGYRFEIVQTSTMVAKPDGPRIRSQIQSPAAPFGWPTPITSRRCWSAVGVHGRCDGRV